MSLKKVIIEVNDQLTGLDKPSKINIFFVALSAFCVLGSYPFIRSSATALFLQNHGAKNSPLVWLGSVGTLAILVTIYNFLQTKFKIHHLFGVSGILTGIGFVAFYALLESGQTFWSYPLFILKEAYIVLLFHMVIGYLNSSIDYNLARSLLGPLGAIGSLGGLLGGLIVSNFAKEWGLGVIVFLGVALIFCAVLSFWFTDQSINISEVDPHKKEAKKSLLSNIGEVKKYVFTIAAVIALAQFTIALMNFKFNLQLEEAFPDKIGKAQFLAQLYTGVNGMSLLLQIFVIPIALRLFHLKNIHLFIPISYLGIVLILVCLPYGGILPIALGFWFYKSFDYSVFQTAKELLYYPLGTRQKYAAKYINDMVVYRLAKGAISLILIFIQSPLLVNIMLVLFTGIWAILLIPLFKLRPTE